MSWNKANGKGFSKIQQSLLDAGEVLTKETVDKLQKVTSLVEALKIHREFHKKRREKKNATTNNI